VELGLAADIYPSAKLLRDSSFPPAANGMGLPWRMRGLDLL
jgi:hypothetical protein